MKQLLEIIVKNLVDEPDLVSISESKNNNTIILKLKVAPDDMGKVIGKQGRIAKSIRNVLRAGATHNNEKVKLQILQ